MLHFLSSGEIYSFLPLSLTLNECQDPSPCHTFVNGLPWPHRPQEPSSNVRNIDEGIGKAKAALMYKLPLPEPPSHLQADGVGVSRPVDGCGELAWRTKQWLRGRVTFSLYFPFWMLRSRSSKVMIVMKISCPTFSVI